MTERKPPPRPEWATETPRTGKQFKVHNTLGEAKQAVAWRRTYDYNADDGSRTYYFAAPVKLWRWVNDQWCLVFEAVVGGSWVAVPWVQDKNWGKS